MFVFGTRPEAIKRPASSVLDTTKVKNSFELKIPYWTLALKCCLNEVV